ncbi:MAG: MbtH family NRPS accessory protein [Kiritimatiellae bacterium]|nr:MbtH family NRPS accessory protein [Kiritimatiellia bacterium]
MTDDEYADWQDGDLKVIVNHEEQYSIWPIDRDTPLGWREVGKTGKKAECLEYIKEVWTDMRPLNHRKQMDGDFSEERPQQSVEVNHG